MNIRCTLVASIFTLITVMLLTACHFRFRSPSDVPPAVRTLYVDTPNPYSPLTVQLERLLRAVDVRLVKSAEKAPITFRITNNHWTYDIPPILSSGYATTYTYTLTTTFELVKRSGKRLMGPNSFSVSRSLVQNANQVYTPNATRLMKREITRTMPMLIYEHLTSKGTRCILNKNDKSCRSLVKPKKKIKKKPCGT